MSKRYYWLRLERQFYKRHDIELLRADNPAFVDTYIALMCESIDHEGTLRVSDDRPYTIKDLSVILHVEAEYLESCFASLSRHNLVTYCDDGTIVVTLAVTRIGSETDSAERMRRHRANSEHKKEKNKRHNVTKSDGEVTHSKSKSKIYIEHPTIGVPMNETRYNNLVAQHGKAVVDRYIQRASDYVDSTGRKPYADYASAAAQYMGRDGVKPMQQTNESDGLLARIKANHE